MDGSEEEEEEEEEMMKRLEEERKEFVYWQVRDANASCLAR